MLIIVILNQLYRIRVIGCIEGNSCVGEGGRIRAKSNVEDVVAVGFEELWGPLIAAVEGDALSGIQRHLEEAFDPGNEHPCGGMLPSGIVVQIDVAQVVAQRGEQGAVPVGKMGKIAEGVFHQIALGIGYKTVQPVETRHKIETPLRSVVGRVHSGHLVFEVLQTGLAEDVEVVDHFVVGGIALDESCQFVGGKEGRFHGLCPLEGENIDWGGIVVGGLAATPGAAADNGERQEESEGVDDVCFREYHIAFYYVSV